jgi:hypothetical protein
LALSAAGADVPVAAGDLLPLRPDLERAHLFDAATGGTRQRVASSKVRMP